MSASLLAQVEKTLESIKSDGLYKAERPLLSAQSSTIAAEINGESQNQINLCANNYLGLANHPELIEAAKQGLDSHGFGMASVRFICGTQDIHKQLESRLSRFLKTEDTILFSSCFDANAGIFEVLLSAEDAIISDSLNHASIIDGVRLCKAARYRYNNSDMDDLERCLQESQSSRFRLIVTDGVFSMDGIIARLPEICDLAERYDAMVMVDDSHSVGFMGSRGAGTPDHCQVEGRVQLLSGTLGKALGGASGGYISGPGPIIDLLRQRARPYLFSNSLAPSIVTATLKALEIIESSDQQRQHLQQNSLYFRHRMATAGFDLVAGEHPIIPVMTGDAILAKKLADGLADRGVYVTAFSYPVVPHGQARVRTQISSAHTREQLEHAIEAFISVAHAINLI